MRVGERLDETGAVLHDGDAVYFRRSAGGRLRLDLRRISNGAPQGLARVTGTYVGNDLIDVDRLAALDSEHHSSTA